MSQVKLNEIISDHRQVDTDFVYLEILINRVIPLSSPSQTDSDSIYRRHVQTPVTPHRRLSIASIVHADSLGAVLPTDQGTLKRHLGLFLGICFIIGIIIGT